MRMDARDGGRIPGWMWVAVRVYRAVSIPLIIFGPALALVFVSYDAALLMVAGVAAPLLGVGFALSTWVNRRQLYGKARWSVYPSAG